MELELEASLLWRFIAQLSFKLIATAMDKDKMPRLPEKNRQLPERRVRDMQVGERAVVYNGLRVDLEQRAWVEANATITEGSSGLGSIMTLIERREDGFIVWLEKTATFKERKFSPSDDDFPVVEFREQTK